MARSTRTTGTRRTTPQPKTRARSAAPQRNRKRKNRWPAVRRTILFLAIVALLFWLGCDRRFNIKSVAVEGLKTVDRQEIVSLARVNVGRNLFISALLDHKEITRRIEKGEPAVESASVLLKLPATMILRIQERVPYTQLRINHGPLLLADSMGIPYREIALRDPTVPAIVVPADTAVPVLGKKMDMGTNNAIGAAFSVLNLLTRHDYFIPLKLREIRVQGDLYASIYMSDRPVIRLGLPDDYPLKIQTAAAALAADPARALNADYVDVTLPSKPAIKMKDVLPKPL